MKNVILLFASILFLYSCYKKDQVNYPRKINQVLIGKGDLTGDENITEQNLVINTQADFSFILDKMQSITLNSLTETNIDFNNYTVIAVFDSIKPTFGYHITISNIIENSDSITVSIIESGSLTATLEVAQPFHIVKIPKTTKPVIFQ